MSAAPTPPTVGGMILANAPAVMVSQVTLGFTCYTAEPLVWAREGALAMFRELVALDTARELAWYTSSETHSVFAYNESRRADIEHDLPVPWTSARPRQLYRFQIMDFPSAPKIGMRYREVDGRSARTGHVEFFLPEASEPARLREVVTKLGNSFPFESVVAGHLMSWDEDERPSAFSALRRWSKRYLGIDAQDPDRMAWRAHSGLPGISWLTLIGNGLLERLEIDRSALLQHRWQQPVEVRELKHGLMIQAGPEPTLGDLNHFEQPLAYQEVAVHLAPYFVAEPPKFYGEFLQHEDAEAWFRRLIDPLSWGE